MLEKEYKEIFFKYAEQYRVLKRERYSLLKKMYFEQTETAIKNIKIDTNNDLNLIKKQIREEINY